LHPDIKPLANFELSIALAIQPQKPVGLIDWVTFMGYKMENRMVLDSVLIIVW
jgi:hypothetical protein